jgi:hypothetical protein
MVRIACYINVWNAGLNTRKKNGLKNARTGVEKIKVAI